MKNSPENLKDLYDTEYVRKLHSREEVIRIAPILEGFKVHPGAKVLDVGCGNGPLARLLASSEIEYHGVDFSEAFIDSARRLAAEAGLENCNFHCASVEDFVDSHVSQFDAVFALDVSEHVRDPEWMAIVAAMRKALRPGGKVLLHTPNLDFIVERMKSNSFLLRQFPEHVAVRTGRENSAFFEREGFSEVSVKYFAHYNFLKVLHPLSHLPWIGRFFAARLLITATR